MTIGVGLDLTCLEAALETGVERYARRLSETLPRVAEDLRICVIVREGKPAPAVPEPGRVVAAPSRIGRALWRETTLPRVVAREGLSLLHSPVAAVSTLCGVPRVVTIHDVPDPKRVPGEGGLFSTHRLRIHHASSVARAIVTPSYATRDALAALRPDVADRITVIPHGVDPDYRPTGPCLDRSRYGIPPGPYVLAVGTVRARKDPETLIRGFAAACAAERPEIRLVIAGRQDCDLEPLKELAGALGVGDRTTFTGYVSREDLPDLYREAFVFAMPSRLEGFGIPMIEAMASGAPVVASDAASLPEIGGDAARYFRAGDPAALAAALTALIDDPAARAEARLRGFERAKRFTWETSALRHAELYLSLLERPARAGA